MDVEHAEQRPVPLDPAVRERVDLVSELGPSGRVEVADPDLVQDRSRLRRVAAPGMGRRPSSRGSGAWIAQRIGFIIEEIRTLLDALPANPGPDDWRQLQAWLADDATRTVDRIARRPGRRHLPSEAVRDLNARTSGRAVSHSTVVT